MIVIIYKLKKICDIINMGFYESRTAVRMTLMQQLRSTIYLWYRCNGISRQTGKSRTDCG